MNAEKQQSWKINVRARAKKFHFKFKATKTELTWNLLRFSIFIRLHQFLLEAKLESGTSIPRQKPKTLKSRFVRFFRKFKIPSAKKQGIAAKKTTTNLQYPESKSTVNQLGKFTCEEPVCVGSLLFGTLASLSESIIEKDQKGIVIHGSSILLFLALLFKKYITGKARTLLVFLTIVTAVFVVVFCLFNYMNYEEGYVLELVWKAWIYATSSGCLYVLSQAIYSRFCQSYGVNVGAK